MNTIRMFLASRRRCLALAAALALLLSVLAAGQCSFDRVCRQVRGSTLRLHVLANSDSAEDQALKLRVRDALVQQCARLFSQDETLAQAEHTAAAALPLLQRTAEETLRRAGCADPVTVALEDCYFSTRNYGDYTLPAGQYRALRVCIGRAAGHNWWCVLFPPLCVPAAQDVQQQAEELWGERGVQVVTEGSEIRFAFLEWMAGLQKKVRKSGTR